MLRENDCVINELLLKSGFGLKLMHIINMKIDTRKRLFIEGSCLFEGKELYLSCKTNADILQLFFKGRLRTKDLFLIRSDEEYYLKVDGEYTAISFDEALRYLEGLKNGEGFYVSYGNLSIG